MKSCQYCCPYTGEPLEEGVEGLIRADGKLYPYILTDRKTGMNKIPDFNISALPASQDRHAADCYDNNKSLEMYDNFLIWLFKTFKTDQEKVRGFMSSKLEVKSGDKILVTGIGLGNDLPHIAELIGEQGQLYAQDLSPTMLCEAEKRFLDHLEHSNKFLPEQIFFSLSNACNLPYQDGFFDCVFHFGGINLFDDIEGAINEMDRVVKVGGKVVFGDEGVAPWLRNKEYGKIAICNNGLWSSLAPLELLPSTATEVNITWILGNCFYLIDFRVSDRLPDIDLDVVHLGTRGGSMRTRYFGQLEGIDPQLRTQVVAKAKEKGVSISQYLERVLSSSLEEVDN